MVIKKVDLDCNDEFSVTAQPKKPQEFCKVRKPLRIISRSSIVINFVTNDFKEKSGFLVEYKFKSAFFMCQGPDKIVVSSKKGAKIRSENFPKHYSRSSQCRWQISVDKEWVRHSG